MAEEMGATTETTTENVETTATTEHNNTETVEGKTSTEESTLLGSTEETKAVEKVVPESYEAFTMPEGLEFEAELLENFTALSKELNLSQDEAQKLVDIGNKNVENMVNAQESFKVNQREEWVKSIKEDEEFGGSKFPETITRAKRTINKFGDEKLVKLLNETGYGDNPEIIKLFAKIDKSIGEDSTEKGSPVSNANKTAAQVIYGK